MKDILLDLKKRLYLYAILTFIIALILGYFVNFRDMNIKSIIIAAVFIIL